MKIQIDIPEEINKELKRYKIDYELENLQEAVIKILGNYFFPLKDFVSNKEKKK